MTRIAQHRRVHYSLHCSSWTRALSARRFKDTAEKVRDFTKSHQQQRGEHQMKIRRTLTMIAGIGMGTFAVAAMADPFTLQGVCRVTSIVAGQGSCQLEFLLSDDAQTTPASIAQALVTIDGIPVARYLNDIGTPAPVSTGSVSGATGVSCGATHTVRAYIYRTTSPGTEEKVGLLPAILCPSAP